MNHSDEQVIDEMITRGMAIMRDVIAQVNPIKPGPLTFNPERKTK